MSYSQRIYGNKNGRNKYSTIELKYSYDEKLGYIMT